MEKDTETVKQIKKKLDEIEHDLSTIHQRMSEIDTQLEECRKIQNIDLTKVNYLRRKEYVQKYKIAERTLDRYMKAGRITATKFHGITLIEDKPPRE